MKVRGWVTIFVGVFMVVLMAVVWVWVAWLAAHRLDHYDLTTAQFFGRVYVSFALVVICGFLGIANGIALLRTGRRSRVLTFAIVILFVAALFVGFNASSSFHPD